MLKLTKIKKNYPWWMSDWLKIILTITSTVIGIVFIVIMIYLRRPGNCVLSGKHLYKRRKSKSISQHSCDKGIAMKELKHSSWYHNVRTSYLASLPSPAWNPGLKRELPQLPNAFQNLPESPRFSPTPILLRPKIEKSISVNLLLGYDSIGRAVSMKLY